MKINMQQINEAKETSTNPHDAELSRRIKSQINRTQEISLISEERIIYSRHALDNLYEFLEQIQ